MPGADFSSTLAKPSGGLAAMAGAGGQIASNATALGLRIAGTAASAVLYATLNASLGDEPSWSLSVADFPSSVGLFSLDGDTRPDTFEEGEGGQVATSGGQGFSKPATLPAGDGPWQCTITQRYFSDGPADMFLDLMRDIIEKLKHRDPLVRRKPLLNLTYGRLSKQVWLTDYSLTPMGLHVSGMLRGFSLTLRLTEATARKLVLSALPGLEPETIYHIVQPGETWENIAVTYLSDPLKGVLLRRINPAVRLLIPGITVKVLDRQHSKMRAQVRPRAPMWTSDDARVHERLTGVLQRRLYSGGTAIDALESLTTVPDAEPTPYDPGSRFTAAPAYREPPERERDLRRAAVRDA